MISIRKLVALDIAGLGPKFILAEFGFGVVLMIGLGALSLRAGLRAHSTWQLLAGAYFLLLAVNYAPLLTYAVAMVRRESALTEVEEELQNRPESFRRYRRYSMILLVPLAVPIAILMERRQRL